MLSKTLFITYITSCCLLLLINFDAMAAEHRAKKRTGCSRFVANLNTGLVQESKNNFRCFRTIKKALKQGFLEDDGTLSNSPILANPDYDIERTFTGRGVFKLKTAFRVTDHNRIITVKGTNQGGCQASNSVSFEITKFGKEYEEILVGVEYGSDFDGGKLEPGAITVTEPGIYGINFYNPYACFFEITIQ